jgi:hypothetical protein
MAFLCALFFLCGLNYFFGFSALKDFYHRGHRALRYTEEWKLMLACSSHI